MECKGPERQEQARPRRPGPAFNRIDLVVDDLDTTEAQVRDAGFEPYSHADYEPGRRFYFRDQDGIEFEIVSYAENV